MSLCVGSSPAIPVTSKTAESRPTDPGWSPQQGPHRASVGCCVWPDAANADPRPRRDCRGMRDRPGRLMACDRRCRRHHHPLGPGYVVATTDSRRSCRRGHDIVAAPDGTWLATTSSDRTARMWDPYTGSLLTTLIGHTDKVVACAVAPDGSWIATSSQDSTVIVWDPDSGTARSTLRGTADGSSYASPHRTGPGWRLPVTTWPSESGIRAAARC